MAYIRPRRDIDAALSATATKRAAVKAAIDRRKADIARADADLLKYERQLIVLDDLLDELFDERAQSPVPA